jgi:uracil-DNA glycosylase family 4
MVNFGKGYSNEEVEEVFEKQAPPKVIGNEANEDRGTVEARDESAQEVTEVLGEDDGPFFRVVELYRDEVCQSCPLLPHRNRVVGYEFFGDPPYRVVFIGEAPGEEEALSGRPFVGRSGQILRAVLRELGLESYVIMNTAMCPPFSPGNPVSPPDDKAARLCSTNHLIPLLKKLSPEKVVLLGKVACEHVLAPLVEELGGVFKKSSISDYKKTYFGWKYGNTFFFPVNHPAYILRRGGTGSSAYHSFVSDIRSILEFEHNIPEHLVGSGEPVSFSYFYKKGKIPATPRGKLDYRVFTLDNFEEGFSLIEDLEEVSFDVETSSSDLSFERELILVGLGNHEVQVSFDLRDADKKEDRAVAFLLRLKEYLDTRKEAIVYNQSFEAGVYLQFFGEVRTFRDVFSMTKAFGMQTELFYRVGLKKTASSIFGIPEWSDEVYEYVKMGEAIHNNLQEFSTYLLASPDLLRGAQRSIVEKALSSTSLSREEVLRILRFAQEDPKNPMVGWRAVPTETLAKYNAQDIRWTHELYLFYLDAYPKEIWEIYQKQEDLGTIMHLAGVAYDLEQAERLKDEFMKIAARYYYEMISVPKMKKAVVERRLKETSLKDIPEVKEMLSRSYRMSVKAMKENKISEESMEQYKKQYQELLSSKLAYIPPTPADLYSLVEQRREELIRYMKEKYERELEEDLGKYESTPPWEWAEEMSKKWFNPSSSKAHIGTFHAAITCRELVVANYVRFVVSNTDGPALSDLINAFGSPKEWVSKWDSEIFPLLTKGKKDEEMVIKAKMEGLWKEIADGLNDKYIESLYKLFSDYIGESLDDYPECLSRMNEELAQAARLLVSFRIYKKAIKVITAYLEGKNGEKSIYRASEVEYRNIPWPVGDPHGDKTYFYNEFYVNAADTKRWRAAFHTIPTGTDIRKNYTSRWGKEGVWVHFDYSQMELRVLAAISRDENLINAFAQGLDFHKFVASKIFGIPAEQVSSHQRKVAKGASFSLVYGQTPSGFAMEYLSGDVVEAQRIFDSFFEQFPKVKDYITAYRSYAREYGHVQTIFGDYIDVQRDKPDWERRAQNYPIQSSSSSVAALAGYEMAMEFFRRGLRAVPVAFTHDAIDIDAHIADLFEVLEAVHRLAREVPKKYGIITDIEVEIGTSFFGGLSIEYEIGEDGSIEVHFSGKREVYDEILSRLGKYWNMRLLEEEFSEDRIPLSDIFSPKKALSTMLGKTFETVKAKVLLDNKLGGK